MNNLDYLFLNLGEKENYLSHKLGKFLLETQFFKIEILKMFYFILLSMSF